MPLHTACIIFHNQTYLLEWLYSTLFSQVAFQHLKPFGLRTTLWSWCHPVHFADLETEAQGAQGINL